MYKLSYAGMCLLCDPQAFILRMIPEAAPQAEKDIVGAPFLMTENGAGPVSFTEARVEDGEFSTGTSRGVRAVYSGFPIDKPGFENLRVIWTAEILTDGTYRVTVRTENEPDPGLYAIQLPPVAFGAEAGKGYTVLPRMQGVLFPARSPETIKGGEYAGLIFERDGYMPMFGQVTDTDTPTGHGNGYLAIFDTPYDARYVFKHEPGGDTLISPRFIEKLGCIREKRVMLYRLATDCDFVTLAKIYRTYLSERGKLVTLKQKIAANPAVEKLIGTPVIHTGIAQEFAPDSAFYDKEHPENNVQVTTFATRAAQLRALKAAGLERAYTHFDGWGCHGYDNRHPDVFPPHEAAGGAAGMKDVADTCREIGYMFGIHDQYRDYYFDAGTFDINNAVQRADGSHEIMAFWCGGKQTMLCATFAPEYVRRNYDEFEKLGIKLDGSYLDVFSVVELDECFNPNHPMSREQCAAYRRQCFDFLTHRGIIPSSEEACDFAVPSLALVHHAPYYTVEWEGPCHMEGYPIPLFNLVWHDCLVVPWFGLNGNWGMPEGYDPMGLAYMNGGTVYWPITGVDAEEEARLRAELAFHKKVALGELLSHRFVNDNPKIRESVFDAGDGKTVTVRVDFTGKTAGIELTENG